MELSLDDAGTKTIVKPNPNSIAGLKQVSEVIPLFNLLPLIIVFHVVRNYGDQVMARNTFVCPFAERFNCPVKFRIFASEARIQLETQSEHTAESHVIDMATKFLSLPQTAAIANAVSTNLMSNATTVRRELDGYCMIQQDPGPA
jgi:hypothetical protein